MRICNAVLTFDLLIITSGLENSAMIQITDYRIAK